MRRRDHPRIRGEHSDEGQKGLTGLGSSPHTRGAHFEEELRGVDPGIIPAYAGSTRTRARSPSAPADHPRIRGEHARGPVYRKNTVGSSPHTRGALEEMPDRHGHCRIIPAYAGSTTLQHHLAQPTPDHPRIRGEHGDDPVSECPQLGSSPHTRGALLGRGCHAASSSDHPRIRGEHFFP